MTVSAALSLLLEHKNSFISRYVKRRYWWFIVELPLTPCTVYDDIKSSSHNPSETNITIKFLDSLSTHRPNYVTRTYNEGSYVFGYIHYPNTNVSKWKAAYDLKLYPRCIIPEAATHRLKTILKTQNIARSESSYNHILKNLTTATYKAIHASMGYSKGVDPDKLISAMSNWNVTTLQTQVKNSTIIAVPPSSFQPKLKCLITPNPSNRQQKWEIILARSHRPTTG